MKYLINEDNSSITDRILQINNIQQSQLKVDDFIIDNDNELLVNFRKAIEENRDKKFLIVGDFDCDGICATAIMKRLFDDLKIKANFYIPSRSKEGYGLNNSIVEKAINNNFDCLLTVDNGVKAKEQLELCKKANIKTFVIDHHEYEGEIPADYFLHPNLFSDKYSDMCAGGLCCLLSNSFREDELTYVYGGLATLADLVCVLNYNRILLKKMLTILQKGNVYQLNFLMGKSLYTYDNIAYNVVPKINAVSRLDEYLNVNHVVEYLLSDKNSCANFYHKIDNINAMRKELSKKMGDDACEIANSSDNVILVYSSEYKEGLCGLVANKLKDVYNKPVIVLAQVNDELKGSARSVEGVDIYSYLKKLDIFEAFGGHTKAVGMTLKFDKLDELKEYISNNPLEYSEEIKDLLLVTNDDLNFETMNQINDLAPFGPGFRLPNLYLKDVKYDRRYIVANKYPKFTLNNICEAISFNSEYANIEFTDMIGRLTIDDYRPNNLTFMIEELR